MKEFSADVFVKIFREAAYWNGGIEIREKLKLKSDPDSVSLLLPETNYLIFTFFANLVHVQVA